MPLGLHLTIALTLLSQVLVSLGPSPILCQESDGRAQLELAATTCHTTLPVREGGLSSGDDCGPCTDTSLNVLQDRLTNTGPISPPLTLAPTSWTPPLQEDPGHLEAPTPRAVPPPTFHKTVVIRC